VRWDVERKGECEVLKAGGGPQPSLSASRLGDSEASDEGALEPDRKLPAPMARFASVDQQTRVDPALPMLVAAPPALAADTLHAARVAMRASLRGSPSFTSPSPSPACALVTLARTLGHAHTHTTLTLTAGALAATFDLYFGAELDCRPAHPPARLVRARPHARTHALSRTSAGASTGWRLPHGGAQAAAAAAARSLLPPFRPASGPEPDVRRGPRDCSPCVAARVRVCASLRAGCESDSVSASPGEISRDHCGGQDTHTRTRTRARARGDLILTYRACALVRRRSRIALRGLPICQHGHPAVGPRVARAAAAEWRSRGRPGR
jgi:hypothetical protein